MAMQLLILLCIAAWGGQKLDAYFNLSRPYITILCLLLALAGFLIKLVHDISRME